MFLVSSIVVININNLLSQKQQVEYSQTKIIQFIILIVFNHAHGDFLFVYSFLVISIFPSILQFKDQTIANNVIDIIFAVLVFISFHLKYYSRKYIFTEFVQIGQILFSITINFLLTAGMIILQSIIQELDVNNNQEIKYFTIYAGQEILIFILTCACLVYQHYFNEMSVSFKAVIVILLLCLIFGLVIAGILNLVLIIYISGYNYVKNLDPVIISTWTEFTFPSFSPASSKSLAALISTFMQFFMLDYINFNFSREFTFQNIKFFKTQKLIFQIFFAEKYEIIISSIFILISFATVSVADFINLFFLFISGALFHDSVLKTILNYLSFAFVILIIFLYLFICYKQKLQNGKSVKYGILQFLVGIFAIPGAFSIALVKVIFTNILPCQLQNTGQVIITQLITPVTAALSFIVSFPYFYQLYNQYTNLEQTSQNQRKNLLIASKIVSSANNSHFDNKLPFSTAQLKQLQKAKVYIRATDTQLQIAFAGARTFQIFSLSKMIISGFDWIRYSFSRNRIYTFSQQQTFIPKYAVDRAKLVQQIVCETNFGGLEIVIAGHHFGAISALYLAEKLGVREVYTFNAPMLVKQSFYEHVGAMGIDSSQKLKISSILNQQGKWGNCFYVNGGEWPTRVFSGAGVCSDIIWEIKKLQ
eukprot:EST47719.1 Transmembrane domain-containing protein [Spironucleus salmonicida]